MDVSGPKGPEPHRGLGDRERFEDFYARKWAGHEGFWVDRYPPSQVVYATAVYRRRNAEILEVAGPAFRTAMDLGCGLGDIAWALAARSERVIATDLSFENVRRARANLRARSVDNAVVVQSIGERLPFADRSLDLAVLADVIEHIPDVAGCLAEIRRVLRPGGRVVCVTPIRGTLFAWRTFERTLRFLSRRGSVAASGTTHPDVYERFLSIPEMRSALAAAGLRPTMLRRICFYPAPETPGVFGAIGEWAHGRLDPRRFSTVSGRAMIVFDAVERLRFLNQKQLWVASA